MEADGRSQLLDDIPVGVVVQDPSGEISFANRAAVTLLGRDLAEILGLTSMDPTWGAIYQDGSDFPGESHPAMTALATGEPIEGVVMGVHRPRSEDTVWLLVSAIPRKKDGVVVDCISVFVDISEELRIRQDLLGRSQELRRVVDERTVALSRHVSDLRKQKYALEAVRRRLEEGEAQTRAMLAAMSEGVVLHAGDASIRFANRAAEEALGLTADQLTGRTPYDPGWGLVDEAGEPLPVSEVPSEITRVTGRAVRRKILGVNVPDEGRRWLVVSSDPVEVDTNSQGHDTVVATFQDITVQRNAQLELAAAHQRFSSIAGAIPGVIFEAEGTPGAERFTYLSKKAASLMDLDPEASDVLVGPWMARVGVDPHASMDVVWHAARTTGSAEQDFRIRLSSGLQRWLRVSVVLSSSGAQESFHGVIMDVTAERELQERLLRTQVLESMTQLAAGVAHNFNNALAAVIPNIETAMLSAPESIRAPLVEAGLAAEGAKKLVNQLLLAAKGDQIGRIVDVEVGAVLVDIGRICRSTFPTVVDLRVQQPGQPVYVRGSVSRLQQVLVNLAINGRDAVVDKHARGGFVALRVVEGDDRVGIVVQDNGTGMPPEVLARLGEPFFSTKPPGLGTGLGLASVQGILAEIGGRLQVESEVGVGTTFTVWLQKTAGTRIGTGTPVPDRSLPPLEPRRVLVVDDDAYVRRAIRRTLERLGMQVTESPDGAGAYLEVARGTDLVLLDLSLRGETGAEILEVLTTSWPEVPVVIATGHVEHLPDLSRAFAVVRKPLRQEDLHRLLWRVFDRESHGRD